MTSVGELFVNLGIKGAEKTVGALKDVGKSMGDLGSNSLAAKAAIVGAMYALERLFAKSGEAGTGLTNLNATFGINMQTLQQYQYAARQVGVSNDEVSASFKTLQDDITKTFKGEMPAGMARVQKFVGQFTESQLKAFQRSPELLLQKLQEYSQKETNIGLRADVLKSFGLSEGMQAALARNAFRPEVLRKAPTYSNTEIGQLDKANIAWSNLGNKIEMAIGHFNAKHGAQLVTDISKIVTQVIKLAEAFMKMSEAIHLFQGITKIFEGWTLLLGMVTDATNAITGAFSDTKKRDQLGKNVKGFFSEMPGVFKAMAEDVFGGAAAGVAPTPSNSPGVIAPAKPGGASSHTSNQNITVNQSLQFSHDGKDHQRNADSHQIAIKRAFRQMPAQAGGY